MSTTHLETTWYWAKVNIKNPNTMDLRNSVKLLILNPLEYLGDQVSNFSKKMTQSLLAGSSLLLLIETGLANGVFSPQHIKEAKTLSDLANNVVSQINSVAQLMVALSYVSGIGFAISAIYKFKQHKDNPTQVPVANAFAILAVSILLVFLPGLFKPAARSVFGTTHIAMVNYTKTVDEEPTY